MITRLQCVIFQNFQQFRMIVFSVLTDIYKTQVEVQGKLPHHAQGNNNDLKGPDIPVHQNEEPQETGCAC